MTKRRSSFSKRCLRCKIHHTLCFCDRIHSIETLARISIIMHHREIHLTSNTANLAKLVLPKCEIQLRGHPINHFSMDSLGLNNQEIPLFLFPHENAIELTAEFIENLEVKNIGKNIHLIIPDGSWSQAVKCYRREAGLLGIQCVKLSPGLPGGYKLRKTSDDNRLSTYEAIARALGVIEKKPELQIEMEVIFNTMVEAVMRARTAFKN